MKEQNFVKKRKWFMIQQLYEYFNNVNIKIKNINIQFDYSNFSNFGKALTNETSIYTNIIKQMNLYLNDKKIDYIDVTNKIIYIKKSLKNSVTATQFNDLNIKILNIIDVLLILNFIDNKKNFKIKEISSKNKQNNNNNDIGTCTPDDYYKYVYYPDNYWYYYRLPCWQYCEINPALLPTAMRD